MIMWIRVAGALALTWAALGFLAYSGVLFGGRSEDAVPDPVQQTWARDLFWWAIFVVVMATALLAAARRGAVQLRRALIERPSPAAKTRAADGG